MGDAKDQGGSSSTRSRALLIGIKYKGQKHGDKQLELRGTCEDVQEMKKYLINTWNYPEANIAELIDAPGYVQPTRTNILKYLDLLVQAPTPKTRLFLYYSGHGYQVWTDSRTELDRQDETLVPLDWQQHGLIRDNVLYDQVVRKLPRGCRFTAVFDCCHSGTLLDLPWTRERQDIRPDEMPTSAVTTMFYTARCHAPTSSPPDPDPGPEVRQAEKSGEKSAKKLPLRAMTHPPNPQELSESLTRPLKMRQQRSKVIGPKAHWIKKWFEVLRKPACTVDINMPYSIASLAPLTSTLAVMHASEVGYPLNRPSIGHEDKLFISPIRESFNENEIQLPWELPTRAAEEPASRSVDIQRKRFTENQANLAIRGVSDPLLLPTVFSIGACSDSEEVIEGRTTNAGLLRSALIQCFTETNNRNWEQLLEELWEFTKSSPEFYSKTQVWPVIGSIKKELTDTVEF